MSNPLLLQIFLFSFLVFLTLHDSSQVVRAAESCVQHFVSVIDPRSSLEVLASSVMSEDGPVLHGSILMIHKLVKNMSASQLMSVLPTVLPGLFEVCFSFSLSSCARTHTHTCACVCVLPVFHFLFLFFSLLYSLSHSVVCCCCSPLLSLSVSWSVSLLLLAVVFLLSCSHNQQTRASRTPTQIFEKQWSFAL